ncbi:kinase-like domain-containing protein [Chaetomium sp. MPI-CAGE-AT-0009]|nr:kinase-like domain-containing protein [Chaetomium sp. MPI-CAGE-AT-0009]
MGPTTALRDKINKEMEKKGPKDFFPTSKLRTVIGEEQIKATLGEVHSKLGGQDVSKLTDFVIRKSYPIFASLVMMEKPWLITSFYSNDVGQETLPIQYTIREDNNKFEFVLNDGDGRGKQINAMFRHSSPAWDEADIEEFCKTMQWKFTAPTFQKDKLKYAFASGTVLPFTTPPETISSGGSGRVEKITVHMDHIDQTTLSPNQRSCLDKGRNPTVAFDTVQNGTLEVQKGQNEDAKEAGVRKNPIVALKTLQNGFPEARKKDAEKEAKNLEAVRKLRSDHLIKAIAYYHIGSDHCFLFPMAEHGNLWNFWVKRIKDKEERQSHRGDTNFLVWVFAQLVGIADALVDLHDEHIRHGDLKPENILCFQDKTMPENILCFRNNSLPAPPIRLVVTDVGIAKGHKNATEARAVTSTVVSTARYQPPEMELTQKEHSKLSRRYDVWSLGCILLEFLIWLLYDIDGLINFTAAFVAPDDRFYKMDGKAASIHPVVTEWIKRIKTEDSCRKGTPLRHLVTFIDEKLLVVKVETLPVPEPGRASRSRNVLFHWSLNRRKTKGVFGKTVEMVAPSRASSKEMSNELKEVLENIKERKFEIKRVETR